jgi:hypothetical protein
MDCVLFHSHQSASASIEAPLCDRRLLQRELARGRIVSGGTGGVEKILGASLIT